MSTHLHGDFLYREYFTQYVPVSSTAREEKRADESLIPGKCPAIYFWVGREENHVRNEKVILC